SLVSIPNGNLSNVTITNLGARKLRLLESNLSMRYDTNASNMQNFISQVRSYVENNEKIDVNQRLVYFRNMSASSLDIFIRVYIAVNDIQEELKIREEIFFEIKKIAENNHVDFAFPSTSLYIEQNPTKPGDKTFLKKE
ncbi:MAG TPA: mechanosensitive ion channel, partial [Saprospiraceae bacterium]|nr:mechanosensitive ion channel [Saprospiraceae bacterium]